MTNKEIAKKFSLLGKLLELHGENAFKAKSYNSAYLVIRKWPTELQSMSESELSEISGIGKTISAKISELLNTGELQALNKYLELTPPGIVQMLSIKGFGPKKIATIWKELEIDTIGELLYAINENRLVALKGFGTKTQSTLKEQLEYFLESDSKVHYATAEKYAFEILELLNNKFKSELIELTGSIRRKCQIISTIDILTTVDEESLSQFINETENIIVENDVLSFNNCALNFHFSTKEDFYYELAKSSSSKGFWESLNIKKDTFENTEEVFTKNELPFIIPEFREDINIDKYQNIDIQNIVTVDHIRGCIHNHSTYSDGMNTLKEMADATEDKGYEYLVMTDHSKSAFYANGLSEERLMAQLDEIRDIDQQNSDLRIFSGIESDILSNGDLDYADDVLSELEVIVASIHSNLKMDEEKATKRLIKAIENPYTSILGHPTGRLLLSRKAYPIDYHKVIDACAANNVAIEINANPLRLDLDWTYINYAVNKGVLLSINPDAHSIKGINDIYYGVCVARKGGLTRENCLNCFDLEEFEEWVIEQHEKRA